MSDNPVYLRANGDTKHYIKYQSTGDCVELSSFSDGSNDDPVFTFVNGGASGDPNLLSINKENTLLSKETQFLGEVYIRNNNKLIFQITIGFSRNENYIMFNDTFESMEISGNGQGLGSSVLRIVSPNATPDVLADFELSKTTFEKPTTFNSTVTAGSNLTVATSLTVGTTLEVGTSLDLGTDIIMEQARHIYLTNDTFNRIKATSSGVTGGGLLLTGYDTVRLAEHVNSGRYAELHNDAFTLNGCDLIMTGAFTDEFRLKGGIMDKAQWGGNLGGRTSFANEKFTSANGMIQIEAARSVFSPESEKDCMALRKGLGGHIINFVKEDNSGNMGQIRASTANNIAYDTSSDRRLKTNIINMRSMIDTIMELKPREYNWKADNQFDYGFVAQEVHKVFPHMREDVKCYCGEDMAEMDMEEPVDKEGNPIYFGVDYGQFTPYLIKAMQEQQAMISSQQIQIDELSKMIKNLV